MARSKSPGNEPGTKKPDGASDAGWSSLTWDDLERWAGSRSVERGRSYQRGGRVKDLKIASDGDLLATVMGGDRYATTVALGLEGDRPDLDSICTCPVGASGCKHAVAVVAEYLQAVADGRNVPFASEDDPRWDELDGELVDEEDGSLDWDDQYDEDEDEVEEEFYPVPEPRRSRKTTARKAGAGEWDGKIETHIRARSQSELADLVWSLTRRFPEVYQEFRERIALQEGKVDELVAEARREIQDVTSEPGWRNRWSDEGFIPDYSRIKHRFERLLELGHADEVVALGREFIKLGVRQIGMSNDEGETGEAFGECLPVVFQAVMRSSLSIPERLLFAIDAGQADDYDAIGDASDVVFDAPAKPEDWSAVADTLAMRLKAGPGRVGPGGHDFSRDYQRDSATYWLADALEHAGRNDELRSLYESEARITKSYERLVGFLMEKEQYDEAERWAREGIAATSEKLPGIAANLASRLGELAKQREHWDEVAAHAARKFFNGNPGPTSFDDLVEAARKAGVEESVRAAALHFLETGVAPYRLVSPGRAPAKASRAKSAPKGRAKAAKPSASAEPAPPERVKIDPAWPLPVPDYLVPLLRRPNESYHASTPRPHLDVLLLMAMRDKRPDEVLRWFDKIRDDAKHAGSYGYGSTYGYGDRVAEAVSEAYPERALEIYLAALNAQLPHAQISSYEAAAGYLRKLRPIYKALGRSSEWNDLLTSIRETYRGRPRFMDILDGIDGQTIVQSKQSRRK